MKIDYSNEQLAYFEAKAKFDTIKENIEFDTEAMELTGEIPELTRGMSREDRKKRIEATTKLETEYGKWEALKELSQAENNMIHWSHEQIKQLDKYQDGKEDMEWLFSKVNRPSIREKILHEASKLIPSEPAQV